MKQFVLVPAHNEEKHIREIILRLKKIKNIKILVVDDGSTDKTSEIAKKLGVILVKHKKRRGKGEAIKTGLKHILKNYPKTKYVVLIDADLQYLPEEVIDILNPLQKNKADLVTGFRDWKKVPLRHRLGNWVWRTSFNLLFGTRFKDTNCGFMGMNIKAIKEIVNSLHGGYILENMIFVKALKSKLRIRQVPITVIYKKKSGVLRGIRMVLGVLVFILKEGLKYRFGIENFLK
jgi:glycosyltransferase involved in cell wall biosynthesis